MKNTSSFTTYNDIPVMIELTDEDLTKITAGNGSHTFNNVAHHDDGSHPFYDGHGRDDRNRRDHRRDHRDRRRDHRDRRY
jgi:hypothetical protein